MTRDHRRSSRTTNAAFWLVLLAAAALAGCASAPAPKPKPTASTSGPPSDAPPVPDRNEVVLDNGTKLVANTPTGKIAVTAGPGLLRTIEWDGAKRWAVMQPRQERWAGSLGIHYDGTPPDWKPHRGLTKLKFEEGQRHFENMDDAKIWLQIRRLHFVHDSDGLVVGWKRRPSEGKLQVEVWQFYIDGEKPSYMPGAKDYLIQTRQSPLRAASNR